MTSAAKTSILKLYPQLRKGIRQVQREVLGHAPQLNHRTGYKKAAKQMTGVYLNQYYMDPISKFAKQASTQARTPQSRFFFCGQPVDGVLLLLLLSCVCRTWATYTLNLLSFDYFISPKQVVKGYHTEEEERRLAKLKVLRRRGLGPPKKGSGARKKKK